jgi:branched-chain amino acid aminotransferase
MTTGKILGEKYIINGQPADVAGFSPDMSADVYYEVVRLIDGKILFLTDHLKRLRSSISGSGMEYPGDSVIRENLQLLLEKNKLPLGNIRICLHWTGRRGPDLLCYFVPYFYPEECMYLSGVQLVSFPHERPNPGIKKWDNTFRERVQDHIRLHGVYEAVLLNQQGEITEGSRSNIFFIDPWDRLITPPSKDILPGITRKYVLQICREEGLEIIEKPVPMSELDSLTSCFISGTSPKVLPVWKLDGFQFRVDHPILKKLMAAFNQLVDKNLEDLFSPLADQNKI